MGLKILHSADWHLDSPFGGFTQTQRSALRAAQLTIPDRIARICLEEKCDLVLLAGDLFDGSYSRESLDAARRGLKKCGVPVFITPGNHDYCVSGSPWQEVWPENVHIFQGGLESVTLEELNCRVYGGGYKSMDCPGLLQGFQKEGRERYHIGVLHGDPTQANSPYCPVTAAQVRASGLDYLALGHIHKAGSFRAGDTLCAWPGCPMGRGWDETGEKGLYLVTVEDAAQLQWVALDLPAFHDLTVEMDQGAVGALEEVLPAAQSRDHYRITLTGRDCVDLPMLKERFAHISNLELRDQTEEPVDLWADAGQDTLEGVYFHLLKEQLTDADPETEKRIVLAAEISRRLLEGREVVLP